ncbi:MAG: hypothetical protein JXR25_09785 [Pontiellaceae bacterium]|nr:hypothetical protein [Pontiellaceae bacterium]MBN2785107.1 hypothetical protein [Pontiellaceae bacterium]
MKNILCKTSVLVIYCMCVTMQVVAGDNVLNRHFFAGPAVDLFKSYNSEAKLYEITFIPSSDLMHPANQSPYKTGINVTHVLIPLDSDKNLDRGEGGWEYTERSYITVNGHFEVEVISSDHRNEISEENYSKKMELNKGDGGRLKPLLSIKNDDFEEYFFYAVGDKEESELLKFSYFGPFLQSERCQLRQMASELILSKRDAREDRSDARNVLLTSKNKWSVKHSLFLLWKQNCITATDFISNPVVFSGGDTAIINDMFIYAAGIDELEDTIPEALIYLVRNHEASTALAVFNHLTLMAEKDRYEVRRILGKRSELFDQLVVAVSSQENSSSALLDSIRRLKYSVED